MNNLPKRWISSENGTWYHVRPQYKNTYYTIQEDGSKRPLPQDFGDSKEEGIGF